MDQTFEFASLFTVETNKTRSNEMATRDVKKIMTTASPGDEPAEGTFRQQRRPESGRYLLQVDRQTKGSYPSVEAAEQAAVLIKKGHPIVRVTIYDSVDCTSKVIETA